MPAGNGSPPPKLFLYWSKRLVTLILNIRIQRLYVLNYFSSLPRMWLELAAIESTFSTSPGVVALYRQHDKQMTSRSRARHGLYFLGALFDCDTKHNGLIDIEVMLSKIDYIYDFYGTAPGKAWRSHSTTRSDWLESLCKQFPMG